MTPEFIQAEVRIGSKCPLNPVPGDDRHEWTIAGACVFCLALTSRYEIAAMIEAARRERHG